jgi:hypothetical protein
MGCCQVHDRVSLFRILSELGWYVHSVWCGQKVLFKDVQTLDRAILQNQMT